MSATLKAEASSSPKGQQAGVVSPPQLTLPKGGGAIRGIGEKFSANPVTGTGSMAVPIYTSPGRSGFGPQLSLSYDSGSGNGPFGFGWSLDLPSISRKTDKGLPRYVDSDESDVFILSGAEDLVPLLVETNGEWSRDFRPTHLYGKHYGVQRYRPRVEGLFARIERWVNLADPRDTFWRSISRDNIATWYGQTEDSRIADPQDPSHVFSWQISESYDDKGNVMAFTYKRENSEGIDLTQAHECNRTEMTRSTNRYIKHIRYGNRSPYFPILTDATAVSLPADWCFQVVFDYGEHDALAPAPTDTNSPWVCRADPFSMYRAAFEVRTYRLCRRVLMFHHFAGEPDVGTDCLVRATDFVHSQPATSMADLTTPFFSLLASVTQTGHKRRSDGGYLSKAMPPLAFEYSEAVVDDTLRQVDIESLENLPRGLDGTEYQWIDLNGEALSGILTEQGGAWFYKPNISPINLRAGSDTQAVQAAFGPSEVVGSLPSLAALSKGRQHLLDVAGNGHLDLVEFDSPTPGYFERIDDEQWGPYRTFASLPVLDWRSPDLKFIDVTGDGHADLVISEDDAFSWHTSLAIVGFGAAERVQQALDEERGPKLVFGDGTGSIFLADMSGDGLTDLVRIRNGEVCYWPNLGYCRFGPKVTMDSAPWFDPSDLFDHRRIRLADIDGSGTTDIIYFASQGVQVYFNQSGNSWLRGRVLHTFPSVDNQSSVSVLDLLGTSTACLVWSSPLAGNSGRRMLYIDLMGGQKPHLLLRTINNLGAESTIQYAPSTKFYLSDKLAGKPWLTRLPFPVLVVERVETHDHVSRNRFVTRYAYHHGFFDGFEREFRGFGMVEQWDTEEFAALTESGAPTRSANLDAASHVPPMLTKTWFHTGAYLGRDQVSDFFTDHLDHESEYYREPGLPDSEVQALLLPDTILPKGLAPEEEREACRALKGSMLRQEIYGIDGTSKAEHPYTVAEQSFTIETLQPRGTNRHAVFFTHPREAITYHYERNPSDPRIQHALTLEVDGFGNVLKSAAIGYGRRQPDPQLTYADQQNQMQTLITYIENGLTNAIDLTDDHRSPLPAETRTYELTGYVPASPAGRVYASEFVETDPNDDGRLINLFDDEIQYEQRPTGGKQRRLIEQVRTFYRKDDLTGLLNLEMLESRAISGESFKLAFTPSLLGQVFRRNGQPLLPNPADVLGGQAADRGGYVDLDGNGRWWIGSGRTFLSPDNSDTSAEELAYARQHFFLTCRYRDPFHTNAVGTESIVTYDGHDLLMLDTRDPLGNRVTVGERTFGEAIDPNKPGNDYRVLRPRTVMDANRNRTAVAYDALGLVVGTTVMGKPEEMLGDSFDNFDVDLSDAAILDHLANPLADPHAILGKASTRLVYDLFAYHRTRDQPDVQAVVVYTLARETHENELVVDQQTKVQHSFIYSDGFGREIQKKAQAEPGSLPARDANGKIIIGANGQPQMTPNEVSHRWVGTGWTVFNNKAKPVRQYEPFFTDSNRFEFDVKIGVSPVLFYDPVERVVATLHPDHTWEKVIFDPWRQDTWDVNDTVLVADPKTDPQVGYFVSRLPDEDYLPTWYDRRQGGVLGTQEQHAARKAAIHAASPTVAYADALERTFLVVADNKFKFSDTPPADQPVEEFYRTRISFDIEGNQREIRDANDRSVIRYDYDMLGNRIHQASMEGGERWMLNDVVGKSLNVWDDRDHWFRTAYDQLRRPTDAFLREGAGAERLVERSVYGETQLNPEANNLRGKVVQQFDQAGVASSDQYDFKNNLLHSRRQLAQAYKTALDWSGAVPVEAETYVSRTRYDALNRPIQLIPPHSDKPGASVNVIEPIYNEASLLEQVHAWLNRDTEPAHWLDPATANLHAVTDVDYNPKGQRELIAYGNGVRTIHTYDPLTFRLVNLFTQRNAMAFPSDCAQPPPAGWPGCQVQNLHYTYDPVGNITEIRDDAQQTIYFRNKRVEPSAEYTYDATYRLIEATGREHLGQVGGAPIPHSYNDVLLSGIDWSANDGSAMGRYLERYSYDAVGNFLEMQHRGIDPGNSGWTRAYTYNETSLLESANRSNRLSNTIVGATNETYSTQGDGYDAHGNMLRMPHLQVMQWDFKDQLQMAQRQAINVGDTEGVQHQGERVWFVYDSTGQRVRKVTELSTGQIKNERIYLGGFEVYRKNGVNPLVRETLPIMDDKQRIALVERRTQGTDAAPEALVRYELGDHLGSASLELDDQAQIISYEEYTPYGSTSYQAVRSQTDTPKRYRYTGMERDEETGLEYHTARFYAPWLGRWTACDPLGPEVGTNLYAYVSGRPTQLADPTGHDGWDRFWGGVKAVGGALEVVAGGALIVAGAATAEFGVGVLLIGAGAVVGAHGIDTVQSGVRTAVQGKSVDTFTSLGLQSAGMSRRAANLTDAAIGVVGTLGASAVAKAPAVVAAARTGAEADALIHLTTAEASAAINTTQTLGTGASTVYAAPAALADASTATKVLATGLSPSSTVAAVTIPNAAASAFRVPAVVGPATAWQRATGAVYSAGAGSINLTTGAFTRTGVAWNQVSLYGFDAAVNMTLRSAPTVGHWFEWGPNASIGSIDPSATFNLDPTGTVNTGGVAHSATDRSVPWSGGSIPAVSDDLGPARQPSGLGVTLLW